MPEYIVMHFTDMVKLSHGVFESYNRVPRHALSITHVVFLLATLLEIASDASSTCVSTTHMGNPASWLQLGQAPDIVAMNSMNQQIRDFSLCLSLFYVCVAWGWCNSAYKIINVTTE